MTIPSAQEQYLLELINATRLDPLGAAGLYITSYDPLLSSSASIQSALDFFHVDGVALGAAYAALVPAQPLAFSSQLGDAALGHNNAMIAADTQSHQLPGESSLGARATNAGYTGWSTVGENIYAFSDDTLYAHAGFMVDWGTGPGGMQNPPGHRENLMSGSFREIGISIVAETNPATSVGPQVVTQDLGARAAGPAVFILGARYNDSSSDQFYTPGEGVSGMSVTSGATNAVTPAAGGYALGIGAGAATITFSGGGLSSAVTASGTFAAGTNAKIDIVDGTTLKTSAFLTVAGPIARIEALGLVGLALTGDDGQQTIVGSKSGGDILNGRGGNDVLQGLGGTDVLNGEGGNDTLWGGASDDILNGGDDQDTAIIGTLGAIVAGAKSDFTVTGSEGVDRLIGIEQVRVADATTYTTAYLFDGGWAAPAQQLARFGAGLAAGGWTNDTVYPRELGDVNGDGRDDIVGFGYDGAFVALAKASGGFDEPVLGLARFGAGVPAGGWSNDNTYPRELGDVNGDGRDDIVGFGYDGAFVALANADGTFAQPVLGVAAFGAGPGAGSWFRDDLFPRMLGDVNGDGRDDIVGFGNDGVYVALATGGGAFGAATHRLAAFGASAGGWSSDDLFPRQVADFNGDGMEDLVAFGNLGVQVALATGGGGFAAPQTVLNRFGADVSAGGWTSDTIYPRHAEDVNGDGRADIVGFGYDGVTVAMATEAGGFTEPRLELGRFGAGVAAGGWNLDYVYPRELGDVNADGMADIVGFGFDGVSVSTSNGWFFV